MMTRLPDWLKRGPPADPVLDVAGRSLPVVIRRLAHARRMTMRLAPDGCEVRISIPKWGRTADALAFAETRREWLSRQLEAMPENVAVAPGSAVMLHGTLMTIIHDPAAPRRPVIDGDTIRIGGTAEALPGRLRRWLEAEARRILATDLVHYCARAGKPMPKLALSTARRRWGSCSTSGTVRLNWRLVMAPDFVRRSVVAHEVAHLVHFDHSPRFHALLGNLYEGDIVAANAWLGRGGRELYRWFAAAK